MQRDSADSAERQILHRDIPERNIDIEIERDFKEIKSSPCLTYALI